MSDKKLITSYTQINSFFIESFFVKFDKQWKLIEVLGTHLVTALTRNVY